MIKTIVAAALLISSLFAVTGFAQGNSSQRIVDDKVLTEFFSDNKIKATGTQSGLYYVITKKGTGDNAKAGQKVSMKYMGTFLDGKKFDANVDAAFNCVKPFTFTLGVGQVIRGWDEGVQLLSPGTRATLYIPSGLGYGARATGPIPPNSILVFDVELVSVDK
jgi:FKBP-type peptidyl-prolyl cis-trans isomerase FkpA